MRVAVSKDLLIAGRHFIRTPTRVGGPQVAGRQSIGPGRHGRPAPGVPAGPGLARRRRRLAGGLCARLSCAGPGQRLSLIGGDTTRSLQDLTISVTVFGAVPAEAALRRDAAQAGDDVWVSGALGAADVAYRLLDGQLPPDAARLALTRRALEWPRPAWRWAWPCAAWRMPPSTFPTAWPRTSATSWPPAAWAPSCALPSCPGAWPGRTGRRHLQRALLRRRRRLRTLLSAPPAQRQAIARAARASRTPVSRVGSIVAAPGLRVVDAQARH